MEAADGKTVDTEVTSQVVRTTAFSSEEKTAYTARSQHCDLAD